MALAELEKPLLCQIERSFSKVVSVLANNPSSIWVVIGAKAAPATGLMHLERDFPGRDISKSLTADEYRSAARKAQEFFDIAEQSDPELRLSFSARVPLSITDWDDVQQIFRIHAVREHRPKTPVVVWVADGAMESMLAGIGITAGKAPSFRWPTRFVFRAARTLLRSLLNPTASISPGARLWVAPGAPQGEVGTDTYFGRWWREAPGKNVRIYLAGGSDLKLKRSPSDLPLESFGHVTDVVGAIYDSWHAPCPNENIANGFDRALWCWLAHREWLSGDVFMLAYMRRTFARLLKESKPSAVVIPFEARSWERSLVRLSHHARIPIVGYQHSSLTQRHLALVIPGRGWSRADLPVTIMTCGQVTAKRLCALANAGGAKLVAGAALRSNRQTVPALGNALLVAISSSIGESRAIVRLINGVASRLNMPVIIRPHPTIPIDEIYAGFDWPSSVVVSKNRSLMQDIADSCFVAYSSSTVALEGLIYGRLPIFLDIADILSGDPIDDEAFKFQAASAEELLSCMMELQNATSEKLDRLRKMGLSYAEDYLVAPSEESLKQMNEALKYQ